MDGKRGSAVRGWNGRDGRDEGTDRSRLTIGGYGVGRRGEGGFDDLELLVGWWSRTCRCGIGI